VSCGSSSCLLAQSSYGAATCPLALTPSSRLRAAPEPLRVPWCSTGCGLLKQINIPRGIFAIMIFHRGEHVSSKTLHDKADIVRLQDVQWAAH
jgi:hypothetical protein